MDAGIHTASRHDHESRLRRHNHALMDLNRRLWTDEFNFDAALRAITEIGADVLAVERVNVWRFEDDCGMRCVHGFERKGSAGLHNPDGFDETIAIDHTAYAAALPTTRVICVADIAELQVTSVPADDGLTRYFEAHSIQSVLDAPVRVDGGMYGVICHEHVGAPREWDAEEIAFAGNMGDFVALAVEVHRRKRAEARLEYLALNDAVTGLPNRTLFLSEMLRVLQRIQSAPRLAAVLFIDIDRFTTLNTQGGEQSGDGMLAAIGARIQGALPDEMLVARVESDCFAVLLPKLDHEWQAACRATDVLHAIAELPHPVDADAGERADLSASIGVAFADGTSLAGADTWLADADAACKSAKERGRGRYEVFDADLHRGLLDRLMTEARLREAMRAGDFVVAYQPEVDTSTGRILAAEALLRWRVHGTLRPAAEFIDVAESSGLIVPIGRWVLSQACECAATWPVDAHGQAPVLRVNLSARQFDQAGLVDMVREALHVSSLPAARLCLELTETTLMTRAESALATLNQLRALGVSLAIDDFGTGYSSLTYLKRFPVDTIKIDRSFVEGLPDNRFDLAIVQAVVGLARTLDLEIVAEGVERRDQERVLREHGITRAQGWLYSKALEDDAFRALCLGAV